MNLRKCSSLIDQFVACTANTETPELLRRWAAIGMVASVLEQKVWLQTSSPLYPNIYTFLIAPPGIGKSRVLNTVRQLIVDAVKEPFIAPTSVNAATVVDQMVDSKRSGVGPDMKAFEYNALTILVSEFGTFMSKYEDDMVAMLTAFYDVEPYGQRRRGSGLKLAIQRPLLNMMIGSTPAALLKFMPENAWEQGFTSRIIFACSDERKMVDDFAYLSEGTQDEVDMSPLVHDLKLVNNLYGKFVVTQEYANAVKAWREAGEELPEIKRPSHPKLTHYLTRRKAHLYRLSMIAAVDTGNALVLDTTCFNRAMSWLIEVEAHMPSIFRTASEASDERAIGEIHHFVMQYNLTEKKAMSQHRLVSFARTKIYANNVLRVLDVMIHSGSLRVHSTDAKTKMRYFIAQDPSTSVDRGQALLQ